MLNKCLLLLLLFIISIVMIIKKDNTYKEPRPLPGTEEASALTALIGIVCGINEFGWQLYITFIYTCLIDT